MKNLVLAGLTVALAACSATAQVPGARQAQGSVPPALVGSWYAGAGGLSAPYDPATGTWGTPSGQGLVYVFHADGSYTKAFQSYNSAYGCTNGFTAFETGMVEGDGSSLRLHPTAGHLKTSDSCAPSLNSDKLLSSLSEEDFSWSFVANPYGANGSLLRLVRGDGASADFRQL